MNDLVTSGLVGFFLPLVISFIMQPRWSDSVRVMVSVTCCLIGGAATAYATGGFNNKDTRAVLLIVLGSTQLFYKTIWKPTVAKWIEEHTTPQGSQDAPAQDSSSAPVSVPVSPAPTPVSVQDVIVTAATDAAATAAATGKVPISAELLQDVLRVLLPGAEAQLRAAVHSPAPSPSPSPAPVPAPVLSGNPFAVPPPAKGQEASNL
jgi:hypothetical protein